MGAVGLIHMDFVSKILAWVSLVRFSIEKPKTLFYATSFAAVNFLLMIALGGVSIQGLLRVAISFGFCYLYFFLLEKFEGLLWWIILAV